MRSLSLSKARAVIELVDVLLTEGKKCPARSAKLKRSLSLSKGGASSSDLVSRSGFTHTKTTKCELASLKQHILLNVFAHINLFPTSTKCRQIASPQRLTDSPNHRITIYSGTSTGSVTE